MPDLTIIRHARRRLAMLVEAVRVDLAPTQSTASAVPSAASQPALTVRALQTMHPELYDEIFARGVAAERDRCTAHSTLGFAAGLRGVELARDSIRAGSSFLEMVPEYQGIGLDVMLDQQAIRRQHRRAV